MHTLNKDILTEKLSTSSLSGSTFVSTLSISFTHVMNYIWARLCSEKITYVTSVYRLFCILPGICPFRFRLVLSWSRHIFMQLIDDNIFPGKLSTSLISAKPFVSTQASACGIQFSPVMNYIWANFDAYRRWRHFSQKVTQFTLGRQFFCIHPGVYPYGFRLVMS